MRLTKNHYYPNRDTVAPSSQGKFPKQLAVIAAAAVLPPAGAVAQTMTPITDARGAAHPST